MWSIYFFNFRIIYPQVHFPTSIKADIYFLPLVLQSKLDHKHTYALFHNIVATMWFIKK